MRSKRALPRLAALFAGLFALLPVRASAQHAGEASPAEAQPSTPAAPAPAPANAGAPDPRYAALPELTFRAVNSREEVRGRLYLPDGRVDEALLARLARLFRDGPTGEPSPLVPRTMQLLVRIAQHFQVTRVEVVSAFRTGRSSSGRLVRREGYHGVGSAVDFRLPGVDVHEVAAYARTLAHVGVGCYPRLGFVHLDSREQTFFWENAAGRRRHGWNRPLDRHGVPERDRQWSAEADAPWDPPGERVELVLHPPTQRGARRPHRERHARSGHGHHRGHGRAHHRSSRRRLPVRVFEGAAQR